MREVTIKSVALLALIAVLNCVSPTLADQPILPEPIVSIGVSMGMDYRG